MPRSPEVCLSAFCPRLKTSLSSVLRVLNAASYLSPACCLLLLLATLHVSLITAHAQSTTATLSGVVMDESGAVVPGVKIDVMNAAQAFRRTTTTNDDGIFTVQLLPPGTYAIKAEKTGFAPSEMSGLVLNVNSLMKISISLKVGQISQTVEIFDPSAVSESATVGTVVDRQFVENLPLNGRSFQSLLTVIPGLVFAPVIGTDPGQFNVNGQRSNANYFMVDGVSANASASTGLITGQLTDGSLPALTAFGGTNNLVSVDALEEFKVQTSSYSAEFGRTPGAQISIATRAGTNEFHGTLFEYFRNDVLDANDWFFNASSKAKAPLRQNDFGGVIGGPVLLPRFGEGGSRLGYDGHNRTFFFFSYEGLRLRQPFFLITDVPSLSARQNALPSVRPVLDAFPLPNGPENAVSQMAQFSASFSNPSTLNATSIRIDHRVGQRFSAFGRYNDAPSETVQRSASTASVNTLSSIKTGTRTLTGGTTFIFTPTINNELRANYSRNTGTTSLTIDSFGGAVVPPDSFFLPSFTSRQNATVVFSLLGGRFSTLLFGTTAANTQRQFNVVDNFSVISGDHNLKFGVDYRRLSPIIAPRTYAQIYLTPLASVLAGTSFLTLIRAESTIRRPVFTNLSLYGQDIWHLNTRLTLTYGLRWELNVPPSEQNGNGPRTVTGIDDAATVTLAPVGTPLYGTTYNNFAPRFGLSYQLRQQPGSETTLRGGVGIFYDLGSGQAANAFGPGVFPYASDKFLINSPFPPDLAGATPAPISDVPSAALITAFEQGFKLPYTIQFNAAVEQSLGANQGASISYVGARGRRLLRTETLSAFPAFLDINIIRNSATSDYDSLQMQFQRRLSRHLQALASYTFSKSLDTSSKETTTFASAVRIDPRQDRGPSDFDIRHVFSAAISYDLPVPDAGPVGNAFLRGWSIDGITRANSALPVDVTTGTSFLGSSTLARPDLVEGVPLYINDASAPGGRRINPDAFIPAPVDPDTFEPIRQGTLGRNALRGFSFFQTDLTLRRQFKLNERFNLQFKADFFNIFNHPNFANPCSSLSECPSEFGLSLSMFGRGLGSGGINGGFSPLYQMGGPRSIQFSLKLNY
ncbi:MAG TPA: TonB-dependent receptor [Pyrinomonadaceae bacterium]